MFIRLFLASIDPPVILDTPSTHTVRVHGIAELNCIAKGEMPLNITWLMDGKVIGNNIHSRCVS